jgi:5-methyltetrahydrofolate--homocysteine methyltransferase
MIVQKPEQFTIIGENIHATRVVLRNGRRAVTLDDGTEAVPFKGESGEQRYLTVPQWFKETQPYEQGQIKHFLIAMMKGIRGDPQEEEEGRAYVQYEAMRQAGAGAQYLDINVDEVHYEVDIQKKCMEWTVRVVQEVSPIPPSIDSSLVEVIEVGLKAYDGRAGRPLVNSVAFERLPALDMAIDHDAKIIVMATSPTGMPTNTEERVENINGIMEHVQARGVQLSDVFIDGIVFLISVDQQNCHYYLNAVRALREQYGSEIRIGGGLSNVSFGMPNRKLINEAFIYLGLEAGIDAGIMDPIQTKLSSVFDLDTGSERVKIAMDMLLGNDDFCLNFIQAHRDGRLA